MPLAPTPIAPSDLTALAACVKEHTLKKATNEQYFSIGIAPPEKPLDIPYPNNLRILHILSTGDPKRLAFVVVVMGGSNLVDGVSVYLTNTEKHAVQAKVSALVAGIEDLAKYPQKSFTEVLVV